MLGTTASRSLTYLLVAAGCTTAGVLAASAYTATPRTVATVSFAPPQIVEHPVERVSVRAVALEVAPVPSRAGELKLVVQAGSAPYMLLAPIGDDVRMPKHGKPTLYSEDGIETAIAPVAAADVPASYQAWLERQIRLDNTGCVTKVTGFAVLSRLTGDPGYAGEDVDTTWTAKTVFENGSTMLVAALGGCTGTFARDAALAPYVTPVEITDTELAAKLGEQAKAIVLASAAARATQKEWLEAERTGSWTANAFEDIKVLRHPTTGDLLVSVHIWQDMACGEPDANVWGLFRVAGDGSLVPAQMRRMPEGMGIEQLIDIEGDGEVEVVGRPWLGVERTIERANGDELETLELPFFGCPC